MEKGYRDYGHEITILTIITRTIMIIKNIINDK
jgi:hypothetical protein